MNDNKEIYEKVEIENTKFTFKKTIQILFKSVICIVLMGVLVSITSGKLNSIMSILFIIICGIIIIYNIRFINKYIKFRGNDKVKKDWCNMNSQEKIKYIFKTILSITLQWIVVIVILVWIGSYYGDELVAKLDGENTYKEVVLDTKLDDGITLEDACKNFFGNYKSKYFKTSDDLNIVEVSGKAYFMDKKVDVDMQFIVNSRDLGDFKLYTSTLNDVPQSRFMTESLYKSICDSCKNINSEDKDSSKPVENNIKHSTKEVENLYIDDTLYGDWVSDDGSELTIDENYIGGNPYTVESKKGNMYTIKINADGGYKIGIKSTDKGIMIYTYNEETNSFTNGVNYYNSGI